MKKVKFLLALAIAAGVSFLTSCGGSEDAVKPKIKLLTESVQDGDQVVENDTITFSFNVVKGDNTVKTVKIVANNSDVWTAEDATASSFEAKVVAGAAGTVTYSIVAIDNKDNESKEDLAITIIAPGEINTFEGKILGAGRNPAGSYISLSTGTVYKKTEAEATPANVDMIFNSTADAAFVAAGTESANAVVKAGANAIKLKKTDLTEEDFDAIENDLSIINISDIADSKVEGIAAGDVSHSNWLAVKKDYF